jgi:hypothetical protein
VTNPTALSISCGDIRVVFDRDEGRWAHRVELIIDETRALPLFTSVEDSPSTGTLSSPPIQELQLQNGPDGTCAVLGVGMAGRNHWSLACGARHAEASHGAVKSIRWEVACRVREARPMLASTYRLLPPASGAAVQAGALKLAVGGRKLRLRCMAAELSITGDEFAFTARNTEHSTAPRTVQWSYIISGDSELDASGQVDLVRDVILGKQSPRSMPDMQDVHRLGAH